MIVKWTCLILHLIISVQALTNSEVETFINLMEFGYENACNKVAQAEWNFINKHDKRSQQIWENALEEYAEYIRLQKAEIGALGNETHGNSLAEYKYNLVTKPGDALLDAEKWKNLISFIGDREAERMTADDGKKLTSESSENNPNEKLDEWRSYYENVYPLAENFSKNLQLAKTAAIENGLENVGEYWAMLSGYEKGYEEIERMWNDIVELHEKVVKVAKFRLSLKYPDVNNNNNSYIPGHLIGLAGQDDNWMSLTLMMSPYPNVTFEIEKNMLDKSVGGIQLYKLASRLGHIILRHQPGLSFWNDSQFNGRCPSKLINFCNENTLVATCRLPSMANYISAHKEMASVLIHKISSESNPILTMSNRYSPLEAGISEFFGILSVSRAWLVSSNLTNKSDDLDEIRIISLLITALDVLPRMAHYLATDMWRLDALNNNNYKNNQDDNNSFSNAKQLTDSWWTYREKYESITTFIPRDTTPTYLNDQYIINNKPYIHKFLGILLGFQIYEYLMESTEMRYDKVEPDTPKRQLIKMIQHNWNENWNEIINKYLEINEISTDSLLSYFTPLEQYLDKIENNITAPMPLEFESTLSKLRALKNIDTIQTVSTSTTTSSITNTDELTLTTTTQLHQSEITTPHVQHYSSSSRDKMTKILQPNSPIIVNENKSDSDNQNFIKSGTNKAVWAVGAVLVATIAIAIIAIFGRRRCRKSPKNRRYV